MRFIAVLKALVFPYLYHEKGRTFLTVLGIALGVSVLIAISLTNQSAIQSFKNTVSDVSGEAQITIQRNTEGIDPRIVAQLYQREEVASLSPLNEGLMTYSSNDGTENLLFLGVDLLRSTETPDVEVRDISFTLADDIELTQFLTRWDYLILTETLLERIGKEAGDQIQLQVAGIDREFLIAGVIGEGSLLDTMGGNVSITDIGASDYLLRRNGTLDRIDLVLAEGESVEESLASLRKILPETLLVERPERRQDRVDNMIAAFKFNLKALGYISVLVGAFLVYNSMSIAVRRRRTAIGTVRALGISQTQVRSAFLFEALLIGGTGSLLGLILGTIIGQLSLSTVEEAISINFFQANSESLRWDTWSYIIAFAVGSLGSVIAALAPANEAASTPPANTMKKGTWENKGSSPFFFVTAALVIAFLGYLVLLLPAERGLPVKGYSAALLIVAAAVILANPVLLLTTILLKPLFVKIFRAEGLLSISSTKASLGRATVATSGLVISLGMAISVSIMIASFRTTVVTWMDQVLLADLYISPLTPSPSVRPEPIPASFAEDIAKLDGVEAIDPFSVRPVLINGEQGFLGAGALGVVEFANESLDGRPMNEVLRSAKANDTAITSEAFARTMGLERGDEVTIPTPKGDLTVKIEALYYDYSSERGYLIIDRDLYLSYFDDPQISSIAVYTQEGVDLSRLRDEINAIANSRVDVPPLATQAHSDLKAFALAAFDRTFAITYLLQIIAIVVSILGVTTTLLSQVMDRKEEIVTLKFLGATPRRVVRIFLLETTLIGTVGLVLGAILGIVLSWILTKKIMLESFGWTIEFGLPLPLIAQIMIVVFAAILITAIFPAQRAGRYDTRLAQSQVG